MAGGAKYEVRDLAYSLSSLVGCRRCMVKRRIHMQGQRSSSKVPRKSGGGLGKKEVNEDSERLCLWRTERRYFLIASSDTATAGSSVLPPLLVRALLSLLIDAVLTLANAHI